MRAAWIAIILTAIILSLSSPMIPHGRNDADDASESNIENITIGVNMTGIKERALKDDDFNETLEIFPGVTTSNMTLDSVIVAKRDGGQIWLGCVSRIGTNQTVLHYKWTRIVDNDTYGDFGKSQKDNPAEEESIIAISNITSPTRTARINCTLSVLDIAGNEQAEQQISFIIS